MKKSWIISLKIFTQSEFISKNFEEEIFDELTTDTKKTSFSYFTCSIYSIDIVMILICLHWKRLPPSFTAAAYKLLHLILSKQENIANQTKCYFTYPHTRSDEKIFDIFEGEGKSKVL